MTVVVNKTESKVVVSPTSPPTVVITPTDEEVVVTPGASPKVVVSDVGTVGPQGPIGTGASFTHVQGSAEAVWTIIHDLGYRPAVFVYSGDSEVVGDIDHTTANSLTITFAGPLSGVAYLS